MSTERDELVAAIWREIPQFVSATALFQVAVADQLGLPASDLHCMNLVQSGIADTPTTLAERMGMTTGAVTKMLDRMEGHRLVRREPDPGDRRRVTVRALPDRMAELAGPYASMGEFLNERIASFSASQLRGLVEFAAAGREIALAEASRMRQAGKPHATRKRRAT